jgi:hypothetical protein
MSTVFFMSPVLMRRGGPTEDPHRYDPSLKFGTDMLMKGKSMSASSRHGVESVDAEALAIRALDGLAATPERLGQFLAITGLSPQSIREVASSPGFLAAVLDHVTGDEALLMQISAESGIAPEAFARAREQFVSRDAFPDD